MLRAPRCAATVLAGGAVGASLLTGCSATEADAVSASSSATAAALSSAAQASPGSYGTPVNPALPNPTDVATDPAGPSVTGAATVIITYASWVSDSNSVEVGGFVQGVVESGGTCTLTLSGSGAPTTTSGAAEGDAGSTTCPTLTVDGDELASGRYVAVVSYTSDDVTGTSEPTTLDVP